jgi:hypothetical protein
VAVSGRPLPIAHFLRGIDKANGMNAKRLPVLALAIALAACAATGPRYADHVAASPDIPQHLARLTVFRTAERTQYSGRSATVRIDGSDRGGCAFAGFQTFHVPAGHHVLAVDLWDSPGRCTLSIDVLGGEEYFYEVTPRSENMTAYILGTVIGALGGEAARAGAPFAAIGAESSGKACGGAFAIVGVDESAGRRQVRDLRMSK